MNIFTANALYNGEHIIISIYPEKCSDLVVCGWYGMELGDNNVKYKEILIVLH